MKQLGSFAVTFVAALLFQGCAADEPVSQSANITDEAYPDGSGGTSGEDAEEAALCAEFHIVKRMCGSDSLEYHQEAVSASERWTCAPSDRMALGCCMRRDSDRNPWVEYSSSFATCEIANLCQDEGDDIFEREGLYWFNLDC